MKGDEMKIKEILVLAALFLLGIVLLRVLFSFVGVVVGMTLWLLAAFGVLLFVLGIIIFGYSRTGFIPAALVGLAGVILLGLALPFLAPLFFFALALAAVAIILKKRKKGTGGEAAVK
jgi:hypothetical protein